MRWTVLPSPLCLGTWPFTSSHALSLSPRLYVCGGVEGGWQKSAQGGKPETPLSVPHCEQGIASGHYILWYLLRVPWIALLTRLPLPSHSLADSQGIGFIILCRGWETSLNGVVIQWETVQRKDSHWWRVECGYGLWRGRDKIAIRRKLVEQ